MDDQGVIYDMETNGKELLTESIRNADGPQTFLSLNEEAAKQLRQISKVIF